MSAIGMPGHILALFAPRPAPEFVPYPKRRKHAPHTGLGDLMDKFEIDEPPKVPAFETPKERKKRLREEKDRNHEVELKLQIEAYDPHKDPDGVKTQDPSKTLFVGRLSYEANEKKLLSLFEAFGPVHDIRVVTDQNGRPRGYAFVEFERGEDMRLAFREADGRRVEGRRIVLDVERARTDSSWLPRRLGGGRGPQREGKKKDATAASIPPRHSFSAGVERERSRDFAPKNRERSPFGGRGGESYQGPSGRSQVFRDREFGGERPMARDSSRGPPMGSRDFPRHDARDRNSGYRGRLEMGPSDRSREFRSDGRRRPTEAEENQNRSYEYRGPRPRESERQRKV